MKELTENEIKEIYQIFSTPPHIIKHCRAVSESGYRIACALKEHGYSIDPQLVKEAGIIHDAARLRLDHGFVISEYLRRNDHFELSEVVANHMRYVVETEPDRMREIDCLCLGDRIVIEGDYVGVDQRFEDIIAKVKRRGIYEKRKERLKQSWKNTAEAVKNIERVTGYHFDEMMRDIKDREMRELFEKAKEAFAQKKPAVFVTAVYMGGEIPAAKRMLVTEDGCIAGDLGMREAQEKVLEAAGKTLQKGLSGSVYVDFQKMEVPALGLPQDEKLIVYLLYMDPEKAMPLTEAIALLYEAETKAWLITDISDVSVGKLAVYAEGIGFGGESVPEKVSEFLTADKVKAEVGCHRFFCERL